MVDFPSVTPAAFAIFSASGRFEFKANTFILPASTCSAMTASLWDLHKS
ncbi:hypothetical protein N624_1642 [Levilactobacillus brevis]|nr:hypothetical protein N624_1642 [Levilactobacillus brevis]